MRFAVPVAILATIWLATISAAQAAKSRDYILDHIAFRSASKAPGHRIISYTWQTGEREARYAGAEVARAGKPLHFTLATHGQAADLTLMLREFRTVNNGGVAYLVAVNGRKIALRNEKFSEAGPSTGFVDIPADLAKSGTLNITLTNLADRPVEIAEVELIANLEQYARAEGMFRPLDFYLTGRPNTPKFAADLAAWKARPDVKIGLCYETFGMAQWPPEKQKAELDNFIKFGQQSHIRLEISPISWWAGTPNGSDGHGGHWTDVKYQQVTYSASHQAYGLTVPNQWSSTPWLTMGNAPLNQFKADSLQEFGSLVRQSYLAHKADFPIKSIVVDNEPTYWCFGNPGGSPFSEWDTPDAVADFNPAMVAAAKEQHVTLDPRDGLSRAEKRFLRDRLTAYDAQMHAALHAGLGAIPVADHVYTHSFETLCNGIFDSVAQAVESGVVRDSRLGVEGDIQVNGDFDQYREIGVPAAINVEFGGRTDAGPIIQAAYATGCDHITLFNSADGAVANIRQSLDTGWDQFKPRPWRPVIATRTLAGWLKSATGSPDIAMVDGKLSGTKIGQDNRLLLHLDSRQLTGSAKFGPLALHIAGRAFVFRKKDPNGFLAISVGKSRDSLKEVARLFDTGGFTQEANITALAKDSRDLWVEFDFHPLGLNGWVNLADFSLVRPWADENLIATNRSYRADRLRAEASLVGWRADASWSLNRADAIPADRLTRLDKTALHHARALFAAGSYANANSAALAVLHRHAPAALPPPKGWTIPAPDREALCELAHTAPGEITINPYSPGFTGRTIAVSPAAQITLAVNSGASKAVALADLQPGDDLQITMRGGQALAIRAARASADAQIVALTPATPFSAPIVTLAGQPPRAAERGVIKTADGKPWQLQVGAPPLKAGEMAHASWNPRTGRLLDLRVATASANKAAP